MKQVLIIKADTNDADYVTRESPITDEKLELFKPLIAAIKEKHGVWRVGECRRREEETISETYPEFDEELIDRFGEYVPYGEYGVHTIESIRVVQIASDVDLLRK